ncbi:MAG: hypothetical protein E6R03_00305 [Hyphomicrobiaceae bacterium]|nr:MAG: hypothetical protein E6R03_00305 [Hyphomicrobiaceae bacterium]
MADEVACSVIGQCGVGGWGGPQPGDPDGTILLSASVVYGGIRLRWTLPAINPEAVAHVEIHRGVTTDFQQSMRLDTGSGGSYFDQVEVVTPTTFFYWVRVISIHGTIGALVGPASATAVPVAIQTIEHLSGLIDQGLLAQSLREPIERIALNYTELTSKIAERVAGDAALSAALALVQQGLQESVAFIHQEIVSRTNGQEAIITQLNTLAAVNGDSAAAIFEERSARVAADEAQAQQMLSLNAALSNVGAIVNVDRNASVSRDNALASQIATVQSTLGTEVASVRNTMETRIDQTNGRINAIWNVQVDVNGNIGGFGLMGTGRTIEAGFDVDKFWIGRAGKVRPFIIQDGVVYMDTVRIRDLTIGTQKLAPNSVTSTGVSVGGAYDLIYNTAVNLINASTDLGTSLPGGHVVVLQASIELTHDKFSSGESSTSLALSVIQLVRVANNAVLKTQYHSGTGARENIIINAADTAPTSGYNLYELRITNQSDYFFNTIHIHDSMLVVQGAKR